MSSENWVKPSPQGDTGLRGLQQDAELTSGDNQPRERLSRGSTQDVQEEDIPEPRSPAQNKTQEVRSEQREVEGQLRKDVKRGTSARRSGEAGIETQDGGPGVCGERWDVIL